MTRRRAAFRGARGRRRAYEWESLDIPLNSISTTAGTAQLLGTPGAAAEDADQTLVRTRGVIMAYADFSAVDQQVTIAVGIAVLESKSIAAGIASLPLPFTDRNSDAFVYVDYLCLSSGDQATSNHVEPSYDRLKIDSKAMRKLSQEVAVVAIVEVVNGTAGQTAQVFGCLQLLAMKV